MEIKSIKPSSRTGEIVTLEDGSKAVRLFTKSNVKYYKDHKGDYHPVDPSHFETISTETVGNIHLRSKNIVSVGIRKDGNPEKYIGLRPDETQATGKQQLEFSIVDININGLNIIPNTSKNTRIDDFTRNLGNIVVQTKSTFVRQMVKSTAQVQDFKIIYKIHAKNLKFSNEKDGDYFIANGKNEFIVNDLDGNFKFSIKKPVLLDKDFNIVSDDTDHTLKDNGDGTYEYIKIPSQNLLLEGIPASVKYIDAYVYSVAASDGYILKSNCSYFPVGGNVRRRHSANANCVSTTVGDSVSDHAQAIRAARSTTYYVSRAFLEFDTTDYKMDFSGPNEWDVADASGVAVTGSLFRFYTKTNKTSNIVGVKALDNASAGSTLASADYDEIERKAVYFNTVATSFLATDGGLNSVPLKRRALRDIKNNNTFRLAVIDYTYDFLETPPANSTDVSTGMHFADGSNDPYLLLWPRFSSSNSFRKSGEYHSNTEFSVGHNNHEGIATGSVGQDHTINTSRVNVLSRQYDRVVEQVPFKFNHKGPGNIRRRGISYQVTKSESKKEN